MAEPREDIDLIEPGAAAEPQAPAPVSAPDHPADSAPSPAEPDPLDPLDQLLSQYDEGTKKPEPAAPEPQADPLQERALDQDGAVQTQARALYEAEAERQRLVQSFEQLCARGQERLPEWVPADYFRSELLAQSISDPRLEVALQAQHLNLSPVAIRVELERVDAALVHAKTNFAKPETIPALEQWKWQLSVAFHARTILKQAEGEIISKAKSRPPIDQDLSADRALIVQSMRGAGGKVEPDAPPNLGRLSDAELRNYTSQFGF